MPTLVISRGSFVSVTTPTLPLNQPPTMKILKRPSASPSASSTNSSTPVGETFKEREARYQMARERIFGASSEQPAESTDTTKSQGSHKKANSAVAPSAVKVVRNPRGPPNNKPGSASENGFRARNKPPTATDELLPASTDI